MEGEKIWITTVILGLIGFIFTVAIIKYSDTTEEASIHMKFETGLCFDGSDSYHCGKEKMTKLIGKEYFE